ncbi:hypothetical protein ACGF07_21380 [Kitasatospora sp. NPDC048194]|uniref:hypothetical protein n=1 Tax=Kitasatospora sp. NPDC048194 TaxID=3364045 RepID=UPI003715F600
MSGTRPEEHADREDARIGPGGPGGSSGREERAGDHAVPGTASMREGYQPESGTGSGSPLEGVEMDTDEEQEIRSSETEDRPDAGPVHRTSG